MSPSHFLTRLYRRKIAASPTDAVLGGLAWVAKIYAAGFLAYTRSAKFLQFDADTRIAFIFFVVALIYAGIQQYLPSFADAKKVEKEVQRILLTSVAIEKIADAVWARRMDPEEKQGILLNVLEDIKSETESICGVDSRIKLIVTLYVHDGGNPLMMRRIAQWPQQAQVRNGPVPKAHLLEIEVLETRRKFVNSNQNLFAIPLISNPKEGQTTSNGAPSDVLGIISIESSLSRTFKSFEGDIETRNLAFTTLAVLILVADER